MQLQLRIYTIASGRVADFVREWSKGVVPLRRRLGFEIVDSWASEEDDTFAWLVGCDGDFAAADAAYYASPERATLDPDPARLIVETRTHLVERVQP